MTADAWPFEGSRDDEAITLLRILRGEAPLRLVTHDDDDGSWQFLDGEHVTEDDAAVIALAEMTAFDPTLLTLADLPPGWHAWRLAPDRPWQRAPGDPAPDLLPTLTPDD